MAQALTELYKQQIVADNRAGAGGLIGAQLKAEYERYRKLISEIGIKPQ